MLSRNIFQLLPLSQNQVSQRAIFTKLHQEVKILLVLERCKQFNNLRRVFELAEDVAFVENRVHEVAATRLVVLHDDLDGELLARGFFLYQIDFAKSALTQDLHDL